MRNLGKTYGDVFKDGVFGPEEVDNLKRYVSSCFEDIPISELENELTAFNETSSGEFTTGLFYLVEDEDDLAEMQSLTGTGDTRKEYDPDDVLFDVAMYLNAREAMALLVSCVTNDGGDIYIIPQHILEEFPTIHSHIFESNQ